MRAVTLLVLGCAAAFSPQSHLKPLKRRGGGAAPLALAAATREEVLGEAAGTAILLTFGYGACASSLGLGGVACVWGLGVALGICASKDLSGAHLNPAVTLMLAARGSFPARKVGPYCAAQLCGGVAASLLTTATWGLSLSSPAPWIMAFGEGVGAVRACFIEAWTTAVLVGAIFFAVAAAETAVPAPVIIGATISGLICLVGPLTGAGFNPVRDLAPRIVAKFGKVAFPAKVATAAKGAKGAKVAEVATAAAFPAGTWAYTVGPILGALAGAALSKVLLDGPRAAPRTSPQPPPQPPAQPAADAVATTTPPSPES